MKQLHLNHLDVWITSGDCLATTGLFDFEDIALSESPTMINVNSRYNLGSTGAQGLNSGELTVTSDADDRTTNRANSVKAAGKVTNVSINSGAHSVGVADSVAASSSPLSTGYQRVNVAQNRGGSSNSNDSNNGSGNMNGSINALNTNNQITSRNHHNPSFTERQIRKNQRLSKMFEGKILKMNRNTSADRNNTISGGNTGSSERGGAGGRGGIRSFNPRPIANKTGGMFSTGYKTPIFGAIRGKNRDRTEGAPFIQRIR